MRQKSTSIFSETRTKHSLPFTDLFSETSSSASFETAITSSEQIGKWSLESAWPGTVPESTWTVEMDYTISDAGGANVNMSATVTIGGSSFTAFLGTAESLFVPQGSGTLSIDVPVEQVPVSGTSEISVSVSARNFVFTVPASGAKVEFFGAVKNMIPNLLLNCPLLILHLTNPRSRVTWSTSLLVSNHLSGWKHLSFQNPFLECEWR